MKFFNNKNKKNKENNFDKKKITILLGILLFVISTLYFGIMSIPTNHSSDQITNFYKVEEMATDMSFAGFSKLVDRGQIDTVYAEFNDANYSNLLLFTKVDDKTIYKTQNPNYDTFKFELLQKNIKIEDKGKVFDLTSISPSTSSTTSFMDLFSSLLNLILVLGMLYYIHSMLKGNGLFGGGGSIGQFKEDIKDDNRNDNEPKTFDEVGGLHALKQDLKTVVDFMKSPEKYQNSGAKLPRGILLVGPPGTGKTLLAKVIAKEAGVDFLYMAGSDFVEMYVGRGASRVRSLFKEARKKAPCIVFIDEIDTLCGKRGIERGEHSEDRKTLTALLAEMDGFKPTENILIIGATNRLEDIDKAALRPGRFTDIFTVPLPETVEERLEIIKLYMKDKKFSEDFDERAFAKEMIGRSPAEIESVLNEAAIVSVKKNLPFINKECVEEAFYKRVMKGHQKDSKETDKKDLEIIAYHEAGHTLIAKFFGHSVTKCTIAPSTSGAGGVTFIQPSERKLFTKKMMEEKVMEFYGGKVAEYLLAGKNWDLTTSGCANDVEEATKILKGMVDNFGMSQNGLVNVSMLSRETTEKSTEYIISLSEELKNRTVEIMEKHFDKLKLLADALLENETIYEEKIDEILKFDV